MATNKRMALFESVAAKRQKDLILVLEDIHDPHNAAAILRTCDALGIQHVFFVFEKEKKYNPRRIGKSSSSSANKWLDFTIFTSIKDCIAQLKKDGFTLIATALTPTAQTVFEADLSNAKLAVLVGNEHAGLSEYALENSDRSIMIPMHGFVQSLNVSVATALTLSEILKQRRASGKKYVLSQKEQKALIQSFQNRS